MKMRSLWSSWLPWLKFRRKTSAPAMKRLSMASGVELAGPRVAMIFALRARRMGYPLTSSRPQA
ncbi:hypothetical protein amb1554 [Paramagnetospirillum magneticum AMB-1]|uniref:Uncharacterized protein n=1 Tax=Paramagnetospirillum magneticum (strain ATCC 700264 / AMB-1) TaxID=342108 RepID=Q2W717_PARM1|nr:hypothetical protein amb1554 [Paramagnetospirillum magneticum AMB-1]